MTSGERGWTVGSGFTAKRIMLVAAVFIVGYFGVLVVSNAITSYRLERQEQALQVEIARLQRRHERLAALRSYMQTDAFIEASARENGLVRPGEIAVVQVGTAVGTDQPTLQPGDAWWQRFFAPADRR